MTGALFAVFMVGVFVRARVFVLATVSGHARLPTLIRLAVVTELSEIRVQNTARVIEGVSMLFELVCVFGAV